MLELERLTSLKLETYRCVLGVFNVLGTSCKKIEYYQKEEDKNCLLVVEAIHVPECERIYF
jgi:hypothetical protein